MTTIVFVHGTGVREPHCSTTLQRIHTAIARRRSDVHVAACYWGGTCGARLLAGGLSIPDASVERSGVPDSAAEEWPVARWALLTADPLYEIRLLAASRPAVARAPDTEPPGELLRRLAAELTGDDRVRAEATAAGLEPHLAEAVSVVFGSRVAREAALNAGPGELAEALARAVVAHCLSQGADGLTGSGGVDGSHRDRLTAEIVSRLGGSDLGVADRLFKVGGSLALRLGLARALERRRAAILDATHPAAGDVLRYLAHGHEMRAYVRAQVDAIDDVVVLLGHSLGGIVCLDLLATQTLPSVRLLATVGSQGPLLYELGALPSLAYGAPLPLSVPRWLNFFDPRDLLAYVGQGLFGERVTDVRVESRMPFPGAHSAYFGNDDFYDRLAKDLP